MIFPLLYRWRLRILWGGNSPYFGRRCRIVARGAINSRLVEFSDGEMAVVSANALRRVVAEHQ